MQQTKNIPQKEFFNGNGKLAGWLKDGIYRKKVNSKLHKMRMFGGAYGIDKNIVEELIKLNCQEIRIMEKDTKHILATSFESFLKIGIERNFDDIQIFLPVKFFGLENNNQQKLL